MKTAGAHGTARALGDLTVALVLTAAFLWPMLPSSPVRHWANPELYGVLVVNACAVITVATMTGRAARSVRRHRSRRRAAQAGRY